MARTCTGSEGERGASIPPERCFSILNDTFDDDQTRSSADYIEYSLQSQYNGRGRA